MIGGLVALAAVVAAVGEVQLLARVARGRSDPASPLLRLSTVATALLLAVDAGHLLAGAVGWAAGFGLSSAYAWRGFQ